MKRAGGVRAPLNIAHRGASGLAPEHTLAAYDLAREVGADYLEQDVQMTADGVLVVLHDEILGRTVRGPAEHCTGSVGSKTLEQLKTCDAGSWFNETFPKHADPSYLGLEIPTLEEVFERYGSKVNYYIETKGAELYPGIEEELLSLIHAHGLRDDAVEQWRILIQSFVPASLRRLHELDPDMPLVQLGFGKEGIPSLEEVAGYAVAIGVWMHVVDETLIDSAHSHCLDVHVYTVNEEPDMDRLASAGVDGMLTDFPDRLASRASRPRNPLDAAAAASAANRSCRGS